MTEPNTFRVFKSDLNPAAAFADEIILMADDPIVVRGIP
jgi:ABC-type hemin transport system ATPase subunit